MQRAFTPFVLFVLCFAAMPVTAFANFADTEARAAALEARVQELEMKLQVMRDRVVDLEAENAKLRADRDKLLVETKRRGEINDKQAARLEAAEVKAVAVVHQGMATDRAIREENEKLRQRNEELAKLAGLATESENAADRAARITEVSDDAGQSRTVTQWEKLTITQGSRSDHSMALRSSDARASDAASAADGSILVEFQTARTKGDYGRTDTVNLEADGKPLELPIVFYERDGRGSSRRTGRVYDETLLVRVSPAALDTISNASSVTGHISYVQFELTRDQIALFRGVKLRIAGD